MATLILTTVGTALGGPIGAAVGAIVGQQIDGALFAPKRRHGPRLGDLAVQTSSYGTQIPKLFGRMRVAGTVIWATDLKEERSSGGGGKGQPKTVNYSYSASFAVALSGRPISAVRRIWADGKLLRGEAGDFKSRTGFRFYPGSESQVTDPLISSIEGVGQAPAHRGIAYALFKDFQLADYGNRIPSLTFEVEADGDEVTIGEIAAELSGGEIGAGETPAVTGYAASGDSVRGAIEALADVLPLSLEEHDQALLLSASGGSPVAIEAADQQAQGSRGGGGRSDFSRRAAGTVPSEVAIAYHEVERDYQAGLQRATRGGYSPRTDRLALPAVLFASAAKAFAEHRLACLWSARQSGKIHLPWRRIGVRAGALLQIEGQAGLWRLRRWSLERMVVSMEVERVPAALPSAAPEANPGRPVAEPDILHGPTTLLLFDLPKIGDGLAERPILVAAAAGASAGWRGATLSSSYDGGASWKVEGQTRGQAVIGRTTTKLPAGAAALIDAVSSVEVELLNASMWVEGRSDDALVAGDNLAVIGKELVQFGQAEPIGGNRFRLSRFLRGRLGSEAAAAAHQAGDPFLLLSPESLTAIQPAAAFMGGELWLSAQGIGDGDGTAVTRTAIEGRALLPLSPVHLTAERLPNGDVAIRWTRRSRSGWAWLSGSDTPLGEEAEAYRITLSGAEFERVGSVIQSSFIYTAAQQAEDGLTGALHVEVTQIGTHGGSPAARLHIHQS